MPSGDNAKKDTGDAGGFVDALVVFISQKPDGRIGTAQLSEFYALPGGAAHRASKELFMPTGVGWAKFCAVGGKGFGRVVYAKDGTAPGGAWLATMELAATTLPRPKPPSPKGHSDGDHESTRAFVDALVLFISQKPDGRIGAAQLCEFYALPGGSDHRALKERHIPAGLRAFCAKGGAACGRIAHVQDSAAPG